MNRRAAAHDALTLATARGLRALTRRLSDGGELRAYDALAILGPLNEALRPFDAVTVIASGSDTIVAEDAP